MPENLAGPISSLCDIKFLWVAQPYNLIADNLSVTRRLQFAVPEGKPLDESLPGKE